MKFQTWSLELNFNVKSSTSYDFTPVETNKGGEVHAIDQ
jgi:hypothetical protein